MRTAIIIVVVILGVLALMPFALSAGRNLAAQFKKVWKKS